jgi:hypothetical protein
MVYALRQISSAEGQHEVVMDAVAGESEASAWRDSTAADEEASVLDMDAGGDDSAGTTLADRAGRMDEKSASSPGRPLPCVL